MRAEDFGGFRPGEAIIDHRYCGQSMGGFFVICVRSGAGFGP